MAEVEIMEKEDRRSALDAFAAVPQSGASLPAASAPFGAIMGAGERVFGAQRVAVQRDEARVLEKIKVLAAAAGSDWYYRFPVKNRRENRTDWIEGASIKLANDLARLYGNNEINIRVQDLGDTWIIYARFIDLETGFAYERPFQQSKGASRMGGEDGARRLDIAFQIGVSKAIRNVIVNALQTFADFAFEEAKGALIEKIGKDLPKWRTRTAERLTEHVAIERVERVLGRKVAEWLAPDVARAIALMKAVSDGMATLDETFPPLPRADQAKAEGADPETGELDAFASAKEERSTEAKPAAPVEDAPKATAADAPAEQKAEAGKGMIADFAAETAAAADVEEKPKEVEPTAEAIAAARQRGRDARAKKMSRKAIPGEYRAEGREAELEAFLAGYDAVEREPGEEG